MKTKEHKESNGCEKYYCWRYALYKINFWTILKKLLQKNDFRRFPLFEIFAHIYISPRNSCGEIFLNQIVYKRWSYGQIVALKMFYHTQIWKVWPKNNGNFHSLRGICKKLGGAPPPWNSYDNLQTKKIVTNLVNWIV